MVFSSLFGGRAVESVTSTLGNFEIVDDEAVKTDSPYDWTPPYWIPNPPPKDVDVGSIPWLRPKQAPMSFVGGWGIHDPSSSSSGSG